MPLDYRLGKNKLWIGAPLRAFVRWESLPLLPRPDGVLVQCLPVDISGKTCEKRFRLDDNNEVMIEISTRGFSPGVYQLVLSIPERETLPMPEPIWILSREQFLQFAHEDAEEEFLPAPPLKGVEELRTFVEDIVTERLRIPVNRSNARRSIISMVAASYRDSFKRPISSGSIRWTTEAMVNEINYMAIGGTKNFSFQVQLTRTIFGLRFQAVLKEPLSTDALGSFQDNEVNELRLLNSRGDLKDFAARIVVTPFSPQVELSVQHAIDVHPVLNVDMSQDARPIPRIRGVGMGKKTY